jgi:hypothetical protein
MNRDILAGHLYLGAFGQLLVTQDLLSIRRRADSDIIELS